MFGLFRKKQMKIIKQYMVDKENEDHYVFVCEDEKYRTYKYYWKLTECKQNKWEYLTQFQSKKQPSLHQLSKDIRSQMDYALTVEAKMLTDMVKQNEENGFIENMNYIGKNEVNNVITCEVKFYALEKWNRVYFMRINGKWKLWNYSLSQDTNYPIGFLIRQKGNGFNTLEKELLSHSNVRLQMIV